MVRARLPRLMQSQGGFTLIELMIAVAVIAILSAIAMPAYSAYVFRARVPVGLSSLSSYALQMEQSYQDFGNYGSTSCTSSLPTASNFTIGCVLISGGQGFTATATGTGPISGASYSIDQNGVRTTLAHPQGVPTTACWTIRGATCDS